MSLANFLSTVRTEGLSRNNRYTVLITPPSTVVAANTDLERVSLFAEASELPGLTIRVESLNIYGPSYPRPVGIDFGQTLDVTFLVDRDFKVRKLFEDWLQQVVSHNSFNISYQTEYVASQITLTQLDTQDEQRYSVQLKDAFPISIKNMPISYTTDDIHRLTVTFIYRKWESSFASVADVAPKKFPQTKFSYISSTPLADAINSQKNPNKTSKPVQSSFDALSILDKLKSSK